MGVRHAEEQKSPLTVVDLDGTYLSCNTLRLYIIMGLRHSVRRFRLIPALAAATMIVLRKFRLVSHSAMKFTCLRLLPFDSDFMKQFAADAKKHLNSDVSAVLESRRRAGHRVLLATAAADCYVQSLWDGDFVASATNNNPEHIECRGEEKLRRVIEYADKNDCLLDTVITDHLDDAALIEYNRDGVNILVRPSKKTLRFFRKLKPAHLFLIEQADEFGITR